MNNPNEQPPLPPEMQPSTPQQYILLRPDDDELPANSVRHDPVQSMPEKDKTPPPPVVVQEGGCQRGCLYGLTGAVGCLFLIVALLVGAIFVTGQTIGNFFNGFGGLFGVGSGQPLVVDASRIYIPKLEKMQALAELTTVKYNYANIVTIQTDMPALLQALYGESLVMVAVGHIEAGIDLKTLTQDDVVYNAETNLLTIRLPAPTLMNCFLNEAQSYVVERNSGMFAANSPTLDEDSRRFALQQFRDKALMEEDILSKAEAEAETIIRDFIAIFNENNAPTVEFVSHATDGTAPFPETCQ